ncbi:sphingomyelin phosphodiesterase isoform X2 [Diachasma alloeum]|uniref:sphingomyelin phosphodiesterase isoform X2 n=1 Tax=Diachasma alloeum TaxID=454923 RepID=UPI0007384CCC|nr:sphingomyelin phosphodiesterase isoform X2 [Diachasma alloeum]
MSKVLLRRTLRLEYINNIMMNKSGNFWKCILFLCLAVISHTSGVVIRRLNEDSGTKTKEAFKSAALQTISATPIDGTSKVNYSRLVWTAEDEKWSSQFHRPSNAKKFGSIFNNMNCFGCNAAIYFVQNMIRGLSPISDKFARDVMKDSIYDGCKARLPVEVCQGIVEEFVPQVYYILKNTKMGADSTCSFVMSGECEYVPDSLLEWQVTFPPIPKPPVTVPSPPRVGAKRLKVLQLSDIHYDPYYQEGSNAKCGNPLCCRSINGKPATPEDAAGKWGDYRGCDTPKRTIDHMLKHIQIIHSDIDYILWTGDLPPHDIWNQTREGNLQILRNIMEDMKKSFPNVTIFPALGNHESAPVNSFPTKLAPSDFSVSWLYDELDNQWRRWLPTDASNTVKRGAFYSVLVRPGFRIISVNTNYCNDKNFWLLMNSTDPANELQWLIDELQGAENRSEKVHIIGHMPPGTSECLKIWSANYYRIINRYESTITAQFFGHTHYDEFELFYDTDDLTRPVSVAYVGPSVTPYDNLNPGYRIYYVDDDQGSSTRQVVDHETWIMNLQKANARGFPTWKKLYSAQGAFGMPSLLPRDWDELLGEMMNNTKVFNRYYKYYYKDSPTRPPCDETCRKQLLCDIRSGRSRDRSVLCQKIDNSLFAKEPYAKFDIDVIESNDIDSYA